MNTGDPAERRKHERVPARVPLYVVMGGEIFQKMVELETQNISTGGLFVAGALNAVTQTLAWMLVFFVASAAASSAYLTVSELFPVELRGMAIAVFYAFGTLVGAGAPTLFGAIVDTGDPYSLLAGYALASAMMMAAAVVGRVFGVDAERRSLEEITSEKPPSGV